MKLTIRKSQQDNYDIFGKYRGAIFILSCSIELNDDEEKWVARYKLDETALASIRVGGTDIPWLNLENLLKGVKYEEKDINAILQKEEDIIVACQEFKKRMMQMTSFNGESIVEF